MIGQAPAAHLPPVLAERVEPGLTRHRESEDGFLGQDFSQAVKLTLGYTPCA